MSNQIEKDVAIIGGGFGSIPAAISILKNGFKVVITDEFDWLGGQVTSQALCVPDDLNIGDDIGSSKMYSEFRTRIRDLYKSKYKLSFFGNIQKHFCPGNARCSHIAAEPNIAYEAICHWLKPYIENGSLSIFTGYKPIASELENKKIKTITLSNPKHEKITIQSKYFLDATEQGDTLPILNLPFMIGSEAQSEFNEPHAPVVANPLAVQSFTYCIAVEFRPGENHTIKEPDRFKYFKDKYKFFLSSAGSTREEQAYFFKPRILKSGARIVPFWNYRSTLDLMNFEANQGLFTRAIINVESNDYLEDSIITSKEPAKVMQDARELSRSYLYWLQTEAPRDEGGYGYPEVRPMPEATGTIDGIAQAPYIREGRRLRANTIITENDISTECQPNARAKPFKDSVGLGGYAIDIHHSANDNNESVWQGTRNYQIPLSALITNALDNFIVAGKSIGVTHIANGAYRLHPEEWAIGEAAGNLASYCMKSNKNSVHLNKTELFNFQLNLIKSGIPIYWYEDVPNNAEFFEAAQILAINGLWEGANDHLRFNPHLRTNDVKDEFYKVVDTINENGVNINDFAEPLKNSHGKRKYDLIMSLYKWLNHINYKWE